MTAPAKPNTLTLKITGPVAIHGRRPGAVFAVPCDDDGVPLDAQWRRRLQDESLHKVGAVAVVVHDVPPATEPAPEAGTESEPVRPKKAR